MSIFLTSMSIFPLNSRLGRIPQNWTYGILGTWLFTGWKPILISKHSVHALKVFYYYYYRPATNSNKENIFGCKINNMEELPAMRRTEAAAWIKWRFGWRDNWVCCMWFEGRSEALATFRLSAIDSDTAADNLLPGVTGVVTLVLRTSRSHRHRCP